MIKLIAADMDGTFLDDKGSFDRLRFERLLDELDKRGILFVVATGNQVSRMQTIFGDLTDRLSFVAGNGSHVVHQQETLALKEFSQQQVAHFFDVFREHFDDYHIVVSSPDASYMARDAWDYQNLADQRSLDYYNKSFPGVRLVEDISDIPQQHINKITLKVPLEKEAAVMVGFRHEFPDMEPLASGFGAIDIILPGIDKAWGLQQLMTSSAISPQQVMAFGDGENDLSMLRLAQFSYAMANASAKIRKQARFTAPANTEAGVLQVIEQYLSEVADD